MMTLSDTLLMAVSLAMDCFSVSIACGAVLRRPRPRVMVRTALLFGLFQAAMPLLGWLVAGIFAHSVEVYGSWVAFLLLLFIGGRMIWQSLHAESEAPLFHPERLRTELLLAIATSIDALAIGVSMAFTGYTAAGMLTLPLTLIGLASLLFSLLGSWLGVRFGRSIARRMRPELLGGIVLVALGLKMLV